MFKSLVMVVLFLAPLMARAQGRAETEVVRIGTSATSYPYTFTKADGCDAADNVCGFEVDLFKEICAAEKLDCRWTIHDWTTIFDGLLKPITPAPMKAEYEYDAIIDSLDASQSRRFQMLFTMSYFQAWDIFVGLNTLHPKLNAQGYPLDIASQPYKIATWSGFLMDELVAAYGAQPKYVKLLAVDDPIAAVQSGKVDMAFVYTGIEIKLIKQDPRFTIIPGTLMQMGTPDPLGGDSVATRISVKGQRIRELFNEGLITVRKSGQYQKISQKWLGRDIWDCTLGPQIGDKACAKPNAGLK